MVEGTALEMRRTCKGTVGSNPTLSANKKAPEWGLFYWRIGARWTNHWFDKIADRQFGARGGAERSKAIAEDAKHALSMFRAIPPCRRIDQAVCKSTRRLAFGIVEI